MIVEIDNIELNFREKRILSGIYLKIQTGRVTALLGRNGSGKSCILNIIFGNLKPKYKHIRIDGKPVLKTLYKTGQIKYLPQYPFISKYLRLYQIFKLYDLKWCNFEEDFSNFSIYKTFRIGKLSGGERRIVEIYITLKSKGTIILLDEPFSHIAPLYIEKINKLIEEQKTHKAILIIDHMYKHVLALADDIYPLNEGCSKKIKLLTDLEQAGYISR